MGLMYQVVQRRDMRKGALEGDTLYYGMTKTRSIISFDKITEAIARMSTASSGDTRLVLKSLCTVMQDELDRGNTVELGDFGRFRMTAGSTGAASEEDFHSGLFKKGHVIFTPGKPLKEVCAGISFEKVKKTADVEPEVDPEA